MTVEAADWTKQQPGTCRRAANLALQSDGSSCHLTGWDDDHRHNPGPPGDCSPLIDGILKWQGSPTQYEIGWNDAGLTDITTTITLPRKKFVESVDIFANRGNDAGGMNRGHVKIETLNNDGSSWTQQARHVHWRQFVRTDGPKDSYIFRVPLSAPTRTRAIRVVWDASRIRGVDNKCFRITEVQVYGCQRAIPTTPTTTTTTTTSS